MPNADYELYTAILLGELGKARELLADGANPNYIHPDGANWPLLQIGIWTGMEAVDLLLEHGADPMLTNQFGERAFQAALYDQKSSAIADRLREFEPLASHDEAENIKLAQRFGTPASLIKRLCGDDLSIGQKADDGTTLIHLLPMSDIYVFRFLEKDYPVLSCTVLEQVFTQFYFSGPIVWCRDERKVCGTDIEHSTTCIVSEWDRFVSDTYATVCEADYSEEYWDGA